MSAHIEHNLPLQRSCTSTATLRAPRVRAVFRRLRISSGLLTAAFSASMIAQSHFCIGGDIEQLNRQEVMACQQKMAAVRSEVMRHGAPADWHFVVVCDEAGWKEYASFSQANSSRLEDAAYSTDAQLRWTFLRGSRIDPASPQTTATALAAALHGVPLQEKPKHGPAESSSRRLSIAMATASGGDVLPQ